MPDIRIFIASSYDTAHERAVVGDAVRRLNDKYEPLGCRVRLHCWEDFTPEFTGTRKQTEYNEQLIKTSDIFVALFRENCGRYTQEEIRVWTHDLRKTPTILDIVDASAQKSAIASYLFNNGLTAQSVSNDAEIYSVVETLVRDCIAKYPAPVNGATVGSAKEIYATIPADRASERAPFGNLVRGIDDLAERVFHSRCRLAVGDAARIPASDYYVAILKDTVEANEETEILSAIRSCIGGQKPDIQLYYNYGDKICSNHPQIQAAITSGGLFSEPYDTLYRVRFNLVRWLHQQTLLSVELNSGIDIQDGWFIFCNLPVIPLTQLGISGGSVVQQLNQLLKRFSFAVLGVNTQVTTKTGEIDLQALEEQMNRADAVSGLLKDLETGTRQKREVLLRQVSERIDTLLSAGITDASMGELTTLIEKKEQLQTALAVHPRELLRTQMLMVQVSDTYPLQFSTTGRDVDAQYLKVVRTADRYGIKDATVEMMRMNYANYLHRQNRNRDAMAFYETAIYNIEALDDRSELLRHYIMHLYVTYINFMSSLGENHRAAEAIKSLVEKESEWEKVGLSETETIVNHSQILACQLRMRPLSGDVAGLLNQSITTYLNACRVPKDAFDRFILADVFCDFPNCIAATSIDAQPYLNMPESQLKSNIDYFLDQVISNAELLIDEQSRMVYSSEALHNWAFFYSNLKGQQGKARELSEKALSVRRQIYAITRRPNALYDVAQTLLMLGATYVNGIKASINDAEFATALKYADECLEIYQSLNQERFPEQDIRVHQAILLKGSILYHGGRKEEGLSLLKKAWNWNLMHPNNSYQGTFKGVAKRILKEESDIE